MIFLKHIEYQLIYAADQKGADGVAKRIAAYLSEETGFRFVAANDSGSYENEILLGAVSRPITKKLQAYMPPEDGFFVGVFDGRFAICSRERMGLAVGVMRLRACLLSGIAENCATWSMASNCFDRVSALPRDVFLAETARAARRFFNTYGTWVERMEKDMRAEDLADQKLTDALVRRLAGGFAVATGYTNVLYRGRIQKLDANDYEKKAIRDSRGHIRIPAFFAEQYFFTSLRADTDGCVDLTAICEEAPFSLYDSGDCGVTVVMPADVPSFADPDAASDGYTNAEYLARMRRFLCAHDLPNPTCDVERTRSVLIGTQFDDTYVYDYTETPYDTYYSPAVLTVKEDDGTITVYAAHEVCRLHRRKEASTVTYLKKSLDGGKTWKTLITVADMRWASLFSLNQKLYLMGCRSSTETAMLMSCDSNGMHVKIADLGISVRGSAPCAVAIARGRIFRAFNDGVLSVDLRDDLFDGASWRKSNDPNSLISRAEYEQRSGKKTNPNCIFWFEEGNVIEGRDRGLYALYRIDANPSFGYAAAFCLSDDGAQLSVEPTTKGVFSIPNTQTKFTVKYDEKTNCYLSFTSLSTSDWLMQRNVLGLVASEDLLHWELVDVLLVDREMLNSRYSMYRHAFQYVDFDFADEDIMFIVREAAGKTCTYHDGSYITLYTLKDYAKRINAYFEKKPDATEDPI